MLRRLVISSRIGNICFTKITQQLFFSLLFSNLIAKSEKQSRPIFRFSEIFSNISAESSGTFPRTTKLPRLPKLLLNFPWNLLEFSPESFWTFSRIFFDFHQNVRMITLTGILVNITQVLCISGLPFPLPVFLVL